MIVAEGDLVDDHGPSTPVVVRKPMVGWKVFGSSTASWVETWRLERGVPASERQWLIRFLAPYAGL